VTGAHFERIKIQCADFKRIKIHFVNVKIFWIRFQKLNVLPQNVVIIIMHM